MKVWPHPLDPDEGRSPIERAAAVLAGVGSLAALASIVDWLLG